ncbi:UNVERIFIED_CONTAM: (+)-neomenthol dehydrogenase [Sesamum radiatum]|uniref:(+)-neomenthol dehydrogenase n=1 Tax=Sesamum radiatum TaxID=300843 RepID=A0AAW2S6Y7_SESRA
MKINDVQMVVEGDGSDSYRCEQGHRFALVRRLAEVGMTVVLTARDTGRGVEAAESLRREGLLNVHFFQLDVANPNSINTFAAWFQEAFGVVDILINNAAVSFNEIDENSVEEAETVIRTNFYGPKMLTEALLPLFRRSSTVARILNISSRLGLLNKLKNPKFKEMLLDEENLSEEPSLVMFPKAGPMSGLTMLSLNWPSMHTLGFWPDVSELMASLLTVSALASLKLP